MQLVKRIVDVKLFMYLYIDELFEERSVKFMSILVDQQFRSDVVQIGFDKLRTYQRCPHFQ